MQRRKEQLSSGARFLEQAKALPISNESTNDPMEMCSGAATTARGMIPGHPAQLVAGMGPGGSAPTRKGARVLRHRGVSSPPTGGVYAIRGETRGNGKREEAQRSASRKVARSRALGWRPAPEINKSTVCQR